MVLFEGDIRLIASSFYLACLGCFAISGLSTHKLSSDKIDGILRILAWTIVGIVSGLTPIVLIMAMAP